MAVSVAMTIVRTALRRWAVRKVKKKSEAQIYLERLEKLDVLIECKLIERRQWYELATSITANMGGEVVQSSGSQSKMADAVNKCILCDMQQLCEAIKRDVDSFVGEAVQFDDITMLGIELKYIRNDDAITLKADIDSIKHVQNFVQVLTQKLSIVSKTANKANIVADEIYSNIVNYSGAKNASVSCRVDDGKLYMTFTDDGIPYNPLDAENPDITASAEQREIGGLGIFMVKKMTESMEYAYEDNKNILKLVIALG